MRKIWRLPQNVHRFENKRKKTGATLQLISHCAGWKILFFFCFHVYQCFMVVSRSFQAGVTPFSPIFPNIPYILYHFFFVCLVYYTILQSWYFILEMQNFLFFGSLSLWLVSINILHYIYFEGNLIILWQFKINVILKY